MGLELLISLTTEKFNFFVGFLVLFFELSKLSFSRLPLPFGDFSMRYDAS